MHAGGVTMCDVFRETVLSRPPQPSLPNWANQLVNKPYLVEEVNEQLKAKVTYGLWRRYLLAYAILSRRLAARKG